MAATDSDLALINSGSLRSDKLHPPGPFKIRDLNQILPMLNLLIVVEISGKSISFVSICHGKYSSSLICMIKRRRGFTHRVGERRLQIPEVRGSFLTGRWNEFRIRSNKTTAPACRSTICAYRRSVFGVAH